MTPSSAHGVTTAVMGNCGVGFAPCRAEDHDVLVDVMAGVEDIPGVVMVDGLPWDWETFPEYLDALDSRRAGHRRRRLPAALAAAGVRDGPARRRPRAGHRRGPRADAQAWRRRRSRSGALGFASSRLAIHKTDERRADPELRRRAGRDRRDRRGVADAGGGLIQFVPDIPAGGYESVLQQVFEAARRRRPAGDVHAGDRQQRRPDLARGHHAGREGNAAGGDITAQMFPRPIGLVIGLELTGNPFVLYPELPGDRRICRCAERVAEMRKPEVRATHPGRQAGDATAIR